LVQGRLRELGRYFGPLDGKYGGGTEAAVRIFQKQNNMPVNGVVNDDTWGKLLPGQQPPASPLLAESLSNRCLALTASFETSTFPPDCFCGIAGNFDGQGLSFGALQWNLGRGTLQPMVQRFLIDHSDLAESIFHEHVPRLEEVLAAPIPDQIGFIGGLQDRRFFVQEPWRGMLVTMGRTPEFQQIQCDAAGDYFRRAQSMHAQYGLTTERGMALMFDIAVQNGSISDAVRGQIQSDFKALSKQAGEVDRLRIIASRRAAVARESIKQTSNKAKNKV